MPDRKLKVIYACPYAHYSGHHPYAATVEPEVLAEAGVDVTLVTFCGITNRPEMSVEHHTVVSDSRFLGLIRKQTIPRWCLMLGETVATLIKAMWLYHKKNGDVIYVRDGEPFLFMTHMLSLPFRSYRWAISLTGAAIFTPEMSRLHRGSNPFTYIYIMAMRVITGEMWRPLYECSLARNRFVFMVQNNEAKSGYSKILNGVFNGKVAVIPLGIGNSTRLLSKQEARAHLGLPQDKVILLSFGAPHSGKNIDTIFQAIRIVSNIFVVFAGTQAFSLGSIPSKLATIYRLQERTRVFDYYVSEQDKPYFFSATDALVLSYTKVFKSTSSMLWEAAKYNLPVISSNANALGDMVREYNLGLLFEAEDAESLAGAIRQFEAMPNGEIEKMRAGCQRFVNEYSRTRWAKSCISVFQGLINC